VLVQRALLLVELLAERGLSGLRLGATSSRTKSFVAQPPRAKAATADAARMIFFMNCFLSRDERTGC
jgi:hypothetical protein